MHATLLAGASYTQAKQWRTAFAMWLRVSHANSRLTMNELSTLQLATPAARFYYMVIGCLHASVSSAQLLK